MGTKIRYLGFLLAFLCTLPAIASDPVGIYALVDRVVLEPNETAPQRIHLWGVFAMAKGRGDFYYPAERGYLYYSLSRGQEGICLKEWADLKAVAGTGQAIGFGHRYQDKGRVRKANETAQTPDTYPIGGFGLVKMLTQHLGPEINRELVSFPAPFAPAMAEGVKPGKVTLITKNIADSSRRDAKYIFELESSSGEKETSSPIAAGDRETKWSPQLKVKPGEKYVWRVWVVDGGWKGPVAASEFKGI